MQNLQVIEVRGIRALTTKQLAEAYQTTEEKIRWNFKYNRDRYVSGKHFIIIEGEELKEMKSKCEFHTLFKQAKSVCFWTEKGALLHAKSLNTDKAWEVYDYLVDFYFRAQKAVPAKRGQEETMRTVVDAPENPIILNAIKKVQEDLICMNILLEECKRYRNPDSYIERTRSASEIVSVIVRDMTVLLGIQPNRIQKQY